MRNGFGVSDVGLVRGNNEDAFRVFNEPLGRLGNLYIVADGMGGHNAGEVASQNAADYFVEYVRANPDFGGYTEAFLARAAEFANGKVFALACSDERFYGMGTTFTACCTDNVNAYFVHAGDSRAYVINQGGITMLTRDHTYVWELVEQGLLTREETKTHPHRNVITRAVGTDSDIKFDDFYRPVTDDDVIMLCSDGLTGMLTDEEICAVVSGEGSLSDKAARLVAAANEKGGEDNVTVVLL